MVMKDIWSLLHNSPNFQLIVTPVSDTKFLMSTGISFFPDLMAFANTPNILRLWKLENRFVLHVCVCVCAWEFKGKFGTACSEGETGLNCHAIKLQYQQMHTVSLYVHTGWMTLLVLCEESEGS